MSELLTYLQKNEPQFRKTRLAALYSDFRRLRTTNPDGYQANLAAWSKGLASAAQAGVMPTTGPTPDRLSININHDLLQDLETKEWGQPLALGTVVREAVGKREWLMYRDFVEARDSVYASSWGIRPWDILSWGLRQLGLGGGTSGEDKVVVGRVVVLGNLESTGKEVVKRMEGVRGSGRIERVFTRAEFAEKCNELVGGKDTQLSELDLELLLKFLARDKAVLVYDRETVKFKAPNEASPGVITSEDTTIASLKTLIKDLETQTTVLTKKVDELGITAKEAVARKNRVAALAALRSKKLAEATLTKRNATLVQLEEVFSKIEQAADQVELVRVMEASTRVLTGLNKQVGGVERVDNVVDQLREQMSQVDEVGNVIAEVGQDVNPVDEGEVDDELEAMEREEMEKREAIERANKERADKEKERREAAEVKRKLDALEEVERQAKEAAKKQTQESSTERAIDESTKELRRMSLEQEPAHVTS